MTLIWVDYFLAAFFTFVAVFYTCLIIFKQKKTKEVSCVNTGERFSAHWFNHLSFRLFRAAIWVYCTGRLFIPNIDQYIPLFENMASMSVRSIGAGFMLAGFLLALVSNMTMQDSWRSGIDSRNKPKLITEGFYAVSRNPSYIGVVLAQFGFFLAIPNAFSLICFLVGIIALRLQIKFEESFLWEAYGLQYKEYTQRVPRFL